MAVPQRLHGHRFRNATCSCHRDSQLPLHPSDERTASTPGAAHTTNIQTLS
jgi:hypothetical protein